jgi:peptidyl-tRNA hydrolase, PTH1 family
MIKLIVGLGNPGRQYEKTRHNAGFLFLDELVVKLGCKWVNNSGFQGMFSEISIGPQRVILLKPNTFMNRSGLAVGKVARYYKLMPNEILIIHDELDFDVGKVRLKKDGGHAGHNGLRDIIAHLGSKEFYRLRIGIGRPGNDKVIADFVLSPPSKHEEDLILAGFGLIRSLLDQIVLGDIVAAMNKLNSQ